MKQPEARTAQKLDTVWLTSTGRRNTPDFVGE